MSTPTHSSRVKFCRRAGRIRRALALAIWIGCIRVQHEWPRHSAVNDCLVEGQFEIRPNSARQRPLVLVDDSLVDVDFVQSGSRELRPILPPLVLFIERDGDTMSIIFIESGIVAAAP